MKQLDQIVFVLLLICSYNIQGLSQNPGVAANFEIDGNLYSGDPSNDVDDWFLGPSGDGVIDETNIAYYYNLLQSGQNIAFDFDLDVPKYSSPTGYILYDAKYIRDHIKFSGSDGDSTTFTGAKNGQSPEDWTPSGSGNVQGANDIVDAFIHMRRDGLTIQDSLWIDLAVTTLVTNGDHYFDFEIFNSDVSFTGAGFINAGPDEGHDSWAFDASGEIIQTGDLIVGFAVSGGGITNFEVRIWTSRNTYLNTTPANFSWGPEFDGAKNNSQWGYAQIELSSSNFLAVTNVSPVAAPPWGTHNSSSANFTTIYPSANFAEVAVNLTSIGLNNFLSLPTVNPCLSPFAKVMVKSRSSQSFTSALADFTPPVEFSASALIDSIPLELTQLYTCGQSAQLVPLNPVQGAYYEWTTTDGLFENGTQLSIGDTALAILPGTYTLSAAPLAECTRATESITIDAHPCAVDDSFEIFQNSNTNTLDVLLNDYDHDNDINPFTIGVSGLLQPENGFLSLIDDTIRYTPSEYYIGLDSFEYYICDVANQCDTGLVIVNINLDPENCLPGCTEVYRFNWFDGASGNQWPITNGETSFSQDYLLTGTQGDVNVKVTLENSDQQNIDFSNCGTAGNHFYSATCDAPGASSDCDGDPFSPDGQFTYGCEFLTFGITSNNSSETTTFTFEFDFPTVICDLLIGDIDYQLGSGSDSWQDEVDIVAFNGSNPVAINVISGSATTVTNNLTPNVNIIANYDINGGENISPDDPSGQAAISTVAPITSFSISYSNGPDDDGASDDHAIRISSFDVCPSFNECKQAVMNPHVMFYKRF